MSNQLVEVHMGEALCRIAAVYPTLADIILEVVQNAIDANARNISIIVNRKTRHVAISDDGDGASEEKFGAALRHVCKSEKERGKLGQFGIGLISPLGKCQYFTFTSAPDGETYKEWRFETDAIRGQESNVTVPRRDLAKLRFTSVKEGKTTPGVETVMWRTRLDVWKYTKDKTVSRIPSLDLLKDAILERFGAAMRKHDVLLNLKFINEDGSVDKREGIQAKKFSGRPLKEIKIQHPKAGAVTFRMYIAAKTTKGQNGRIGVGEADNAFRFPFSEFARSVDGILSDDVASAMKSGVFEGEIVAEKVKLHESRKSFVRNDALMGLCTAIEAWYEQHGAKYYDEAREQTRDARYQELGLKSLKSLEEMLDRPAFRDLLETLSFFKHGTAGSNSPLVEGIETGRQKEKAVSTDAADPAPKPRPGASQDAPPKKGDEPDTSETFTSAGPRGQQRSLVKGKRFGLQFSHVAMDGSDRLWELDMGQGILRFNINHPIWVACDKSNRKVCQLQETVVLQALTIESFPESDRGGLRMIFDGMLAPQVHLFHNSESFAFGRRKLDQKTDEE